MLILSTIVMLGFPGGSVGKESSLSAGLTGESGLILGLGRSPGGEHGYPLQYSCLESPKDLGAWQFRVHNITKSWTWLELLSTCKRWRLLHFLLPLRSPVSTRHLSCAASGWRGPVQCGVLARLPTTGGRQNLPLSLSVPSLPLSTLLLSFCCYSGNFHPEYHRWLQSVVG